MRLFINPMRALLALILGLVGYASFTPVASADQTFPIAFTGIGIYPRTEPSMDAPHAGDALPDGTMVTIECELEGQAVNNGMATISIWAKTNVGYLPNAYMYTGVDGWTPGVRRCSEPLNTAQPNDEMSQDPLKGIITKEPRTENHVYIDFDPAVHDDLSVAVQLYSHYYDKGKSAGLDAIVDWDFFASRQGLKDAAYQVPQNGYRTFDTKDMRKPDNTLGLATAVGEMTIYRLTEHCFTIYDYYDFKLVPYVAQRGDAALGVAHEFNVFSWGCYQ